MKNELISVIIPIYNTEKYIDYCLDSVCNQTYKNLEIILINDGSTDNSLKICKDWSSKDKRIRIINQKNKGVSYSRNVGIKMSKGKYISFIDSDDWIDINYFSILYDAIKKYDSDIALCDLYLVNGKKMFIKNHFDRSFKLSKNDIVMIQIQMLSRKMCSIPNNTKDLIGSPFCKIYKSKFLKDNNLLFLTDLKMSEDLVFNLYSYKYAKNIYHVNKQLYYYRINNMSACNRYDKNILNNVMNYLFHMKKFIIEFYKNDIFFKDAFNVKVSTSLNKCLVKYFFNKKYSKNYRQMKNELKVFLSAEVIKKGINNVKYQNLTLFEKLFVFLIKMRFILLLKFFVYTREKLKKIINV